VRVRGVLIMLGAVSVVSMGVVVRSVMIMLGTVIVVSMGVVVRSAMIILGAVTVVSVAVVVRSVMIMPGAVTMVSVAVFTHSVAVVLGGMAVIIAVPVAMTMIVIVDLPEAPFTSRQQGQFQIVKQRNHGPARARLRQRPFQEGLEVRADPDQQVRVLEFLCLGRPHGIPMRGRRGRQQNFNGMDITDQSRDEAVYG
jgi:hypothetical protein